jgi:NAD(P)-dependent dehydrogenase (short-subunit alcohol dehydrogenase family)
MAVRNRVAVVVGVGDVVGRACAVGLVQHVEVVVVIDPSEPAAKQAAVAVEEAGGEAMWHAADLTDLVAMERAAEAVAAHHPAVHARVVSFLAGADASYVTGSTLVVDGGRSGLTPGTAVRTPDAP